MSWNSVVRRSLVVLGVAGLYVASSGAQSPAPELFFTTGRSVNTLGPTPPGTNAALAGNPKHKQRNESSCDVSPQNPWVILCANNDYRGIEKFGDSWIGLSMSTDGARTWRDRLLEGFPAAPSGIGAADPVVRTVPGLGLVSYITLSRTDGRGTLSLAVLLERNKENGEPYQFFERRIIGNGTPGRFNDKPAMLAVLDPAGGSMDVGGRTIPKGTVHFSYSLFPGNENNSSSQIYHTFSKDYGTSWSSPKKLSESLGVNQGSDIAVDDATSTIVVIWRQVADTNEPNSMVVARSTDGGQTWSKAQAMWTPPAGFGFFDQDTSSLQFRTRSMPSIVHDGRAFHAFWSARGFAANPDDARIVRSSSRDGRTWSSPVVVEAYAGRGHQIIPQAAVAGGRIQVDWIDTRNNEAGTFDRFITDFRMDSAGNRVPMDAPSPAAGSDPHYIYRQSADIYGAQAPIASPNGPPAVGFSSAQVISRYRFGLVNGVRRQLEFNFLNARLFQKGAVPFNGDYHAVASQRYRPSETTPGAWIRNTAPSTSHSIFYSAFTDNRDVQGYVWAGPPSTSFTPAGVTQEAESGIETLSSCTPSLETSLDQTVWTANDSPRSRYQNIYAATTLPGLVVATPSASKPTGALERAYVIFVQNLTGQDRRFEISVANQPPDAPPSGTGRASFRPDVDNVPDTGCVAGTDCRKIQVDIARASSVTRTVYVRSTQPRPRILVTVAEIGGTQTGSIILNANPSVAEIENPDSLEFLPDILSVENYQPDILSRQFSYYTTGVVNPDLTPVAGVQNPRIEYPRIEYPRIEYPRIEYPRIEYPRIEYDAVGNPRIEYPRIEYPRIEYSSVQNPRIEYSPLTGDDSGVITSATQVAEVTWPVGTGTGANTITGMSSEIFVNGVIPICSATVTQNCVQGAQLIVSVPHFYTVNRTCDGTQAIVVENQVIVNNVVDPATLAPDVGGPDTVNPLTQQPTFFVGPKQIVFLTLRLVGKFDAQFASKLAGRAGVIVRSQPDTSAIDQSDDDQDGAIDTTNPTLDLSGTGFLASVEGNAPGGASVTVNVTATDTQGAATVSCVRTDTSGTVPLPVDGTATFIPLGTWTGTCTAADAAGNETTGTFPIGIIDSTPPTIDVSGLAGTIALTPASGGAIVTYAVSSVTAADVVDTTPTVACTPPSGTKLSLGTNTITCTATDDSGNKATATYTFAVTDTAAPVLSLPSPIIVAATSPAGAVVTYSATATDVVDGSVPVVCAPASGLTFAVGVTTVTCTATDSSGNTASGSFTVTVDATPLTVTATATPSTLLWSPNKVLVPVTVSGRVTGFNVTSVSYRVQDEYKKVQPSGTVSVDATGNFSFVVRLEAYRNGNDADGRFYTIVLTATDALGRTVTSNVIVRVPHDQQ
ncbi:MAG TPA: HYR domain-containing protein [Vicinamibacterales bacterium]|nr:HYR domain-containing protein [Vicinamibacterales bacterium]